MRFRGLVALLCSIGIGYNALTYHQSLATDSSRSSPFQELEGNSFSDNGMPQGHAVLKQLRKRHYQLEGERFSARKSSWAFASQQHGEEAVTGNDLAEEQSRSTRKKVSNLGFVPVNSTMEKHWPEVPTEHYAHLARAFEPFYDKWCSTNEDDYDAKTPAGLLFVKLPKAASSTLSGVVLRMAHRHGSNDSPCITQHKHVDAHLYRYRDPSKSFLLGNIRDIASREVSNVVFRYHTRQQRNLTDEQFIEILASGPHLEWLTGNRNVDLGFQLGYLNPFHLDTHSRQTVPNARSLKSAWATHNGASAPEMNLALVQNRVLEVVREYDFITVAERMDESLVALQLLLGLNISDILNLSSKTSGSYIPQGKGKCQKIAKHIMSPAVSAYLSSQDWYTTYYGDFLLYKAVNKSLDMTIESLGRTKFQQALTTYRDLQARAQTECGESAQFPCSRQGIHQPELSAKSCYEKDWGCGYPCLDDNFG